MTRPSLGGHKQSCKKVGPGAPTTTIQRDQWSLDLVNIYSGLIVYRSTMPGTVHPDDVDEAEPLTSEEQSAVHEEKGGLLLAQRPGEPSWGVVQVGT